MTNTTLRKRTHDLLHNPVRGRRATTWINRALALLIIGNCLAVGIETVPTIYEGHQRAFGMFETCSTLIFAFEYLARLWCAVEQSAYSHPIWGRLRWMLRPVAVLDLLVLITFFAPQDFRFLRLLRLLRLLHVLNLDHMAETYEHLRASLAIRKDLLIVAGMLMMFSMYASAALLYTFENPVQPTVFSSIPATLWWSVITLTTIGYGDMAPITAMGKLCAGLTSIFGIAVFALPAAIVTSTVIDADWRSKRCPHCGGSLHP
jgi:voltage-gated potassium channel